MKSLNKTHCFGLFRSRGPMKPHRFSTSKNATLICNTNTNTILILYFKKPMRRSCTSICHHCFFHCILILREALSVAAAWLHLTLACSHSCKWSSAREVDTPYDLTTPSHHFSFLFQIAQNIMAKVVLFCGDKDFIKLEKQYLKFPTSLIAKFTSNKNQCAPILLLHDDYAIHLLRHFHMWGLTRCILFPKISSR